jgi:peptidoglycan/LPS O-acetylase OafA/YrhL
LDYPLTAIIVAAFAAYIATTLTAKLIHQAGMPLPGGGRIGCIDGLRGYLAVSVLVHHFVIWIQVSRLGGTWSPPSVNLLNNLGAASVALFFMVTGCVFYPIILAGFQSTRWIAVYLRRIFRIVPLVLFSVAIVATLAILRSPTKVIELSDIGLLVEWVTSWDEPDLFGYADTGRINAYVLRTLWFEWLFYIFLLPIWAALADALRGKLPTWTLPVLLLALSVILRVAHLPNAKYLPLFAIGMIAYELQKSEAAAVLRGNTAAAIAVIGMLVALNTWNAPYALIAMALYAWFFFCVACGNSFFGILSSPGALVLGECSFGIYLLHGILLSLLFTDGHHLLASNLNVTLIGLLPASSIVVVLLTAATFRFIERPMMMVGSGLAKSSSLRSAPA